MLNNYTLLILAGFVFSLAARNEVLQDRDEIPRDRNEIQRYSGGEGDPENMQNVVHGNNQFAIDLYQQQSTGDGNLFLSPASVSTLLAMVYAGADNETREQMRQVLHLQGDDESVHDGFSQLMKLLNGSESVQMAVANRLWAQQRYHFTDEYLSLANKYYEAATSRIDFAQRQQAVDTINEWVEANTNHRIQNLLRLGDVDGTTSLVLTNAIYFKAGWLAKFNEEMTLPADFKTQSGEAVSVSMMNQTNEFNYGKQGSTSILEMPYAGEKYSMVLLLPDANDGLAKLESGLDTDQLDTLMSSMKKREVVVQIPKFRFELRTNMSNILKQLGMADAFGLMADFSKMTGSRDLFLDKVIHKAFIEVNEEGSETAAATAALMKRASSVVELPKFIADRPFLYLIRERESGAILFMGRMTTPE